MLDFLPAFDPPAAERMERTAQENAARAAAQGVAPMNVIDMAAVNRTALGSLESLLAQWLPDGKREGREWVARNPTRHDAHLGSFKVNLDTGVWCDFATGDKGGDVVSLYAYLEGVKQGEAAGRLAQMLGLKNSTVLPATERQSPPVQRFKLTLKRRGHRSRLYLQTHPRHPKRTQATASRL